MRNSEANDKLNQFNVSNDIEQLSDDDNKYKDEEADELRPLERGAAIKKMQQLA